MEHTQNNGPFMYCTSHSLCSQECEGQVQDAVLDLLKEKNSQKQVLNAYRESDEPKKVKNAVIQSKDETDITPPPLYRYKN